MGVGQSVTDDCADFAVADPPVPKPYTCAMLLRFAWRAPTTGLLKTVPALLYHFTRAAHLCRWLDDSGKPCAHLSASSLREIFPVMVVGSASTKTK